MSVRELSDYTFVSKYARWIPEKKRRETWEEAVSRVKSMMLEKYSDKPDVLDDIEWAYEMMRKKKVLGSQRALQFGGKPIFKHNARIYNCITSFCDRLKFFQECMYLLLCGCGTGFFCTKTTCGRTTEDSKK
jgi:ribonucleoside-triphosphate reductase